MDAVRDALTPNSVKKVAYLIGGLITGIFLASVNYLLFRWYKEAREDRRARRVERVREESRERTQEQTYRERIQAWEEQQSAVAASRAA